VVAVIGLIGRMPDINLELSILASPPQQPRLSWLFELEIAWTEGEYLADACTRVA
jgi:hypothetical protein